MSTFLADPNRDATAVIRGFVYQVEVTMGRWLELRENELLELECGEDIDTVARGIDAGDDEQRITEQVKSLEANVTLRTPAALECVANFALHRERNPELKLLFRFTTNALPGTEQSVAFPGALPGIVAWERVRSRSGGEAEEAEIAAALRAFFGDLTPASRIRNDAWQAFRRVVDAAADEEWLDFLMTFEWSLGASQSAAMPALIQAKLIAGGLSDAANAKEHYVRLFVHVFRLLTIEGEKRLTRQDLNAALVLVVDPTTHARITAVISRVAVLEQRVDSHELRISDIEDFQRRLVGSARVAASKRAHETDAVFGGMAAAISGTAQNPSVDFGPITAGVDLPAAPSREFGRQTVVDDLKAAAQSGWLAIHGDTGSGKTQLARLFASTVSSPLWLRLTDLPPVLAAATVRRVFERVTSSAAMRSRDALFQDVFQGLWVSSKSFEPPLRAGLVSP